MSDRHARMLALVPWVAPRIFSDPEEELKDTDVCVSSIPDKLIMLVVERMNPSEIYKMQLLDRRMNTLMQAYPSLCKPCAIVNITTADHYHPKLFNRPNTHILSVTLHRMPADYPKPNDINFPGDVMLDSQGVLSQQFIYEAPNRRDLVETASVRVFFDNVLRQLRIPEMTIDFMDVPVSTQMMALMEECLDHTRMCYDQLTLRLVSNETDFGDFAGVLHRIQPKRLKFEGNQCLNIEQAYLPDMRFFIRDNEMGSSEVMSRVDRIVEDWYTGVRDFTFIYIKFGGGGALLPPLFSYTSTYPLVEVIDLDCIYHYIIQKGNHTLFIRIEFHEVRLIVAPTVPM